MATRSIALRAAMNKVWLHMCLAPLLAQLAGAWGGRAARPVSSGLTGGKGVRSGLLLGLGFHTGGECQSFDILCEKRIFMKYFVVV